MPEKTAAPVLTFDIERHANKIVVRCHGRLVAGVNDLLSSQVSQLIPQTKRIVLDLTDLTHMDSMGLGALVRVFVTAKSAGTELQLVNLGKRIRQLLGVTHLLSAFTVIGDNNVIIP